jgi:DNA-binding NarL/FixJ family response regulator
VLLIGKSSDFLRGAADWLAACPRIDLVGTAASGPEGIELAFQVAPDVVLLDESVPEMTVTEVVRRVKSQPSSPCVVLLSFLDDGATRQVAVATGADGVVSKARFAGALLPTLDAVLDGSSRPASREPRRAKPSPTLQPEDE